VLAKTEEWSGFVSTHVVDTGQQITLLTGDGTDAIRRQLWHLKQDEKNYYGPSLNPTIRISVTFETEPSLPEVFRTSFVIKTTVIDGQPRLMIEQADS